MKNKHVFYCKTFNAHFSPQSSHFTGEDFWYSLLLHITKFWTTPFITTEGLFWDLLTELFFILLLGFSQNSLAGLYVLMLQKPELGHRKFLLNHL